MKHSVKLVALEQVLQRGGVEQIACLQRSPLHGLAMAGAQAVKGYWHMALPRQQFAHVRTDVAGAAADEDGLGHGWESSPIPAVSRPRNDDLKLGSPRFQCNK